MEENDKVLDSFDEKQSIQVIKEMIQVSQRSFKNDGILFLLWGWLMFISYVINYIMYNVVITQQMGRIFNNLRFAITIIAIIYTLYYVFKKSKKVKTYIGISLRYVWVSLIVCLVLTRMIIHNVIEQINFELQHPIFMMLIAFAIVVTGGILRYKLVIIGGIVFGILAYVCSYFSLEIQMLFEAAAWILAFIIPGHLLYAKRKQ
jgi:hypothetical protein